MKLVGIVMTMLAALSVTSASSSNARQSTGITARALLTYSAKSPRGIGLCLSRANGSHRSWLINPPGAPFHPSWSPRGRYLAFARGRISRILIADARGRVIRYLTPKTAPQSSYPAWSPDGKRIAYVSFDQGSEIVVTDTRGNNRQTIVPAGKVGRYHGSPAWSPDGRTLAFDAFGPGSERLGVFTIAVGGGEPVRVAERASSPSWSPDGARLVYFQEGARYGVSDIVISRVDGSEPRVLASGAVLAPAWSPGGSLIAYEQIHNKEIFIVVVRAETGARVTEIHGWFLAYGPAWRPPVNLPKAKRRPCR